MRRPRDFDAELQALTDKAKALKAKKRDQLGGLVMLTGADTLSLEELVGALFDAAVADTARKETWRKSGAAFFRGNGTRARSGAGGNASGTSPGVAGTQSPSSEAGAA
jgi:hypothetical protein